MGQSSSASRSSQTQVLENVKLIQTCRDSEIIRYPFFESSDHATNITILLNRLPSSIFSIIETYCSFKDIKNLLNTNKRAFASLKLESFYFQFNKKFSLKYLEDAEFRQHVHKRIVNPQRQIGLELTSLPSNISDESLFPANRVILRKQFSSSLPPFRQVYDLLLTYCSNIERLQDFPKLEKLRLISCPKLTALDVFPFLQEVHVINCPLIADVSSLSHVPIIHLNDCTDLKDISCLGKSQVHVILSFCMKLKDVSSLAQVKKVEIYNCAQLEDVSPLSTVYDLTIADCPSVKNISLLLDNNSLVFKLPSLRTPPPQYPVATTAVQNLKFIACELDNLEIYKNAKYLRLHRCTIFSLRGTECLHLIEIKSTSFARIMNNQSLSTIHTVILDSCTYLVDVSYLGNVHTLKIDSCDDLVSLEGLGGPKQQIVKISHCRKITDFLPLKNIPQVTIISCNHFKNTNDVSGVRILSLERLSRVHDISSLSNVKYLKLSYLINLTHLIGLENVPIIYISNCSNLIDIHGLGNNYRINIEDCENIKDISNLHHIPYLHIKQCNNIRIT